MVKFEDCGRSDYAVVEVRIFSFFSFDGFVSKFCKNFFSESSPAAEKKDFKAFFEEATPLQAGNSKLNMLLRSSVWEEVFDSEVLLEKVSFFFFFSIGGLVNRHEVGDSVG